MKSLETLRAESAMARMDADSVRRAAERAERYSRDPDAYLRRRAAIGWKNDAPRDATPPEELEPGTLPGYKLHLSIDAITDAILELRAEKKRAARHNEDERTAIKSAFNHTFADVGLRLVNIPGWNRWERTIINTRLA
jgi:hypothetical protein